MRHAFGGFPWFSRLKIGSSFLCGRSRFFLIAMERVNRLAAHVCPLSPQPVAGTGILELMKANGEHLDVGIWV